MHGVNICETCIGGESEFHAEPTHRSIKEKVARNRSSAFLQLSTRIASNRPSSSSPYRKRYTNVVSAQTRTPAAPNQLRPRERTSSNGVKKTKNCGDSTFPTVRNPTIVHAKSSSGSDPRRHASTRDVT